MPLSGPRVDHGPSHAVLTTYPNRLVDSGLTKQIAELRGLSALHTETRGGALKSSFLFGFDDTLLQAIDRLLRTPVVDKEIELVPTVSSFEFADPALEDRTDAEKHFLLLGPDNLRTVQEKAWVIALEIGLPQRQITRSEQ